MIRLSCSPNTDAIWIIARPIGVPLSMPLLIAVQPHTGGIEFGEGIGDVEDAPTKPIDRPDQQDVEPRRTASLSI